MCLEKDDCMYWGLRENSTLLECLKPRSVICCADIEAEDDEDDDGVPELNF